MGRSWVDTVPVLDHFTEVADPARFAPLPDDWVIGVSDVVDSTGAIAAGRYKAVNLAGAATISAVVNALDGQLSLFVFGGDGARLAVPPDAAAVATDALARVAAWAQRDLDLRLRVGTTRVDEIRAAGHDARVAFWQASDHVRYAMFSGGGMEWAEAQLKSGTLSVAAAPADAEPDLTGLSCQWGPIRARRGTILSLIVKQAPGASDHHFAEAAAEIVRFIETTTGLNPVPPTGPDVRWPSGSLELQARVTSGRQAYWRRRLRLSVVTGLTWLVFKLGLRIGRFDPGRYRREVSLNTDFRKFDDALMMTVDCSPEAAENLRVILDRAVAEGIIRYGLHTQDEALMTCVVPSVLAHTHMHFVDGAGGGYALAARQLRG
ncbi:MAG: DUF3095 domain-containing protein [Rhodospirillales bacterium]|nr:MAG: DUF3095 domain-containing protein [Rhodospirillales bacterium]